MMQADATVPSRRSGDAAADIKRALREALRGEILSLDEGYISLSDAGILSHAVTLPLITEAERVLCYYSVGREVDTRRLITELAGMGKDVALPICYPGGVMEFAVVRDFALLKPGVLGIPAPGADAKRLIAGKGDVMIVPALAFDVDGYRLGQGGGYYDRYIAQSPCVTVGLCRAGLLRRRVPRQPHDQRVDILLTESGMVRGQGFAKKPGGSD